MCLTIPKKVISIDREMIVVENPNGSRQEMKTIVDLKVGDYVLSQQNVIIEKMNKKEAIEIFKITNKGDINE